MNNRTIVLGAMLCLTMAVSRSSFAQNVPSGQDVSYRSGDETVHALLYAPPGAGPFPALIAIHAVGGLDDWVKQQASKLADAGYLTLAVDLYRGQVSSGSAESLAKAGEIAQSVPPGRRERDLQAAFNFLSHQPNVIKERVGAIGWCMGGSLAIRLAALDPALRVAVAHYPTGVPSDPAELGKISAATFLVLGGKDKTFPLEKGRAFEQQMKSLGKQIESVIYPDAGHAFEMPWSTQGYSAEASANAWRQTVAFLDSSLKANPGLNTGPSNHAPSASAESEIQRRILENERAIHEEELKRESSAAERFYAADFREVLPASGRTITKADIVRFHKQNQYTRMEAARESVQVVTPEVAIYTALLFEGRNNPQTGAPETRTNAIQVVWVLRSAQWQAVTAHGTVSDWKPAAQPPSGPSAEGPPQPDEIAIRSLLADYEAAWNRHDAAALASFYAEDGDVVFPSGRRAAGRSGVQAAEAANHSSINRASHTTRSIESLRFLAPNVAVVDSSVEIGGMTGENGERLPERHALMTTVLVKPSDKWQIAANRATVPATTSPSNTASNDDDSIRRQETAFVDAILHSDKPSLERLLADDCVIVSPSGGVRSKAEEIDFAGSGALHFESWQNKEMKIRMYGATAVVNRLDEVRAHSASQDRSGLYRYTNLWVNREGQWQMVSHQPVRLAATQANRTGSVSNNGTQPRADHSNHYRQGNETTHIETLQRESK